MSLNKIFGIIIIFVLLVAGMFMTISEAINKDLVSEEDQEYYNNLDDEYNLNFNQEIFINDSNNMDAKLKNVKEGSTTGAIYDFLLALSWLSNIITMILKITFMPGFIFKLIGITNPFMLLIESMVKYGVYVILILLAFGVIKWK